MGYQKKNGHMKVQVLKKREEKKYGQRKVHEKKEIAMLSKQFMYRERERDHTKGVSISSTTIHTHAHLDLIV